MGVIRRAVTDVPRVGTLSNTTSVNSSNPESESESLAENETSTPQQQQLIPRPNLINNVKLNLLLQDADAASSRGKGGKRKQRRVMNRDYLLLHKIDEDGEEGAHNTAFNVIEPRKSSFQRLYETMSVIAALASMNALDNLDDCQEKSGTMTVASITKPRHPYLRISRKIRHSIRRCVRRRSKAQVVVQLVRAAEKEILESISSSDSEFTLELLWNSYLHRLLLHAVAQYHGLQSATILTDDDGTSHVVRVVVTPCTQKNHESSLLYDLLRFVYTDALSDALADHDV